MDRGAWWATVHGVSELDMTEKLTLSLFSLFFEYKMIYHEILLNVDLALTLHLSPFPNS